VRWKDFGDNSGWSLLHQYKNSVVKTVMAIYSEHEFMPWLFNSVSQGYWSIAENRRKYISWLVKKTGVEDELKLTRDHLLSNGGGGLLVQFGGSPQGILDSLISETKEKPLESEPNSSERTRVSPNYWVLLFFKHTFAF
jgi:hypothetical protein